MGSILMRPRIQNNGAEPFGMVRAMGSKLIIVASTWGLLHWKHMALHVLIAN